MEGSFVILIADSNPGNRHILHHFLTSELHYAVIEVSTGPQALQEAEKNQPDLIFLDSRLPPSNGYEAAKQLKANPKTRTSRILLMAPFDEADKRLLAIEAGADELLLKPLDKFELLVRVESFLRIKHFYDQLLREKEKVEKMKEDFLAMITHDLKTPLTSIIGNTQLLIKTAPDKEMRLDELRAVDIASRTLLFLVNNLLNVMKLESGMMTFAPEDFILNHLIEEVVVMTKPLAQKKGVNLEMESGGDLRIHADMEKIRQVLSNLLSNAIKFTPAGGAVKLHCSDQGERVLVSVSDNGPGISQEDRVRLFKKFSQKAGEKGGTGLGLFIVKKMLEMHGSEIDLESVPGKGATFSFALPKGRNF